MLKKNKGITLIALVVNIIVLLILAGVSINMLTGQNGILNKTSEAKEKTDFSSDLEYLQIEATSTLIDYYQENDNKSEEEYILDKWSEGRNSKINVDKADRTVTYNGKTYAVIDIIGNESEKNKVTENNMKQITMSNAERQEDKELLSNGKVRIIVEEENGMRAVIPNGFYYVTGKPSNGLVVSDIYGDDDNNTKGGNQFVWIPCSTDINATKNMNNGTTVTYEKVNGLAKTWRENYKDSEGNLREYAYTTILNGDDAGKTITDWKDDGGNTESVKKYGGFYIARYEAGLPENNKLWAKKDNATYGWTNGEEAGSLDGNRNVTTMIPVSKKNNASWNCIGQRYAIEVSKKMYEGSQTVISNLVDSYAWDTILAWYTKSGINCIDSTDYGNYFDSGYSLKNALYAIHVFYDGVAGNGNYWKSNAKIYNFGNKEIIKRKAVSGQDRILYEIGTGGTEYTRRNNIYDLAGNMSEWTTEEGDRSTTNSDPSQTTGIVAVFRGGSFDGDGSTSIAMRHAGYGKGATMVTLGFRVVLYIQL